MDSDHQRVARQEPIDKAVGEVASDILEATAVSIPSVDSLSTRAPYIVRFSVQNTPEEQAEEAVAIH